MSPRARWMVAVVIAGVVFFALTWLDAAVLAGERERAAATFNMGSYMWLWALGTLAVMAAAVLFTGLAWWSRSLAGSVIFLMGGAAAMLVAPVVFTFTGDWPLGLNLALSWWVITTGGPPSAATLLGAALVIAGFIGIYRWATTRRLALTDR
jgi:hypothetical protein